MGGIATLGPGGPVLMLLGLLSVLSLALILARLWALRGVTAGRAARDRGEAAGTAPADRVAARAGELQARGVARAALLAELEQVGNEEVAGMSRGIRALELIGMIAPLLGLLGTVLGMIQSFRSLEMAEGAANASILAGGIWVALLTTAAGLIVAIPALAGAAALAARVERGTVEIERVIARAGSATP